MHTPTLVLLASMHTMHSTRSTTSLWIVLEYAYSSRSITSEYDVELRLWMLCPRQKKTLMRKKELVLLGLEHKFLNYFGKLLPTRWLNANLWPALLTRESHFA